MRARVAQRARSISPARPHRRSRTLSDARVEILAMGGEREIRQMPGPRRAGALRVAIRAADALR